MTSVNPMASPQEFSTSNNNGVRNSSAEKAFNPATHSESFNNQLLETIFSDIADTHEDQLAQAIHHHFSAGGSRTRARIAIACANSLGIPHDSGLTLAVAVELLHNASLIHDDLQDNDEIRRGLPSVWKKFGKNIAVLAGDALINAAYQKLAELDIPHVGTLISVTATRVQETMNGQCRDIAVAESQGDTKITIETCTEIAVSKSGPLLSLPLELCFLYVGQHHHAELAAEAAMHYAIAYQFLDDLEDYRQDAHQCAVNAMNCLKFRLREQLVDHPDLCFLNDLQKQQELEQRARRELIRHIHAHIHRSQITAASLPVATAGILLCAINNLLGKLDEAH